MRRASGSSFEDLLRAGGFTEEIDHAVIVRA
jgi:hypothetical protein